jgi:hypothetical protein
MPTKCSKYDKSLLKHNLLFGFNVISKINDYQLRFLFVQYYFTLENPKRYLVERILNERKKRNFRSEYSSFGRFDSRKSNQQNDDSFKKGTAFESFVVKRFDPEYFTLIEWRGDKSVDGIYPIMNIYPDLEYYFESKFESKSFAVECKWREDFIEEKLVLKEQQIANYYHYENITGNKTFLIIGVGNIPSFPNHVYVIPVSEIKSEVLHEFELEIFRRKNPLENFFLACSNWSLR